MWFSRFFAQWWCSPLASSLKCCFFLPLIVFSEGDSAQDLSLGGCATPNNAAMLDNIWLQEGKAGGIFTEDNCMSLVAFFALDKLFHKMKFPTTDIFQDVLLQEYICFHTNLPRGMYTNLKIKIEKQIKSSIKSRRSSACTSMRMAIVGESSSCCIPETWNMMVILPAPSTSQHLNPWHLFPAIF